MDNQNTNDKVQTIRNEEIAARQILLKRQEKYYKEKLDQANERNKLLSKELRALKQYVENQKKNKLRSKEIAAVKKAEEQKALVNSFQGKVIDCTSQNQSIRNIGFSKEKDKANITGRELKLTYLNSVSCKSSNHYIAPKEAKIIVETTRPKDSFCLSFCSACLRALIKALKTVSESNPYFLDDEKDIEIIYTHSFHGQQCFSCYHGNTPCYSVRMGSISFKLCPDCRACWLMQLESAERKLLSKNQ